MFQSIFYGCFISTLFLLAICEAQLAFHTDPQTNTFTLKAPGLHQTFTRYFGGQQGSLIQKQASEASQHQPQVLPTPQVNFGYQPQYDNSILQQQENTANYFLNNPQGFSQGTQQQQQQQPQYISAQEYAAYLQQQYFKDQEQQIQHQQQIQQQAAIMIGEQNPDQQQPQTKNLLGVAYSPSNQVSHVKFASSGLSYNF